MPLKAGMLVEGHPLDPLLAAFYTRLGSAMFAADIAGIGLYVVDDRVNELETRNQRWQEVWQPKLALPVFAFGGEPALAHYLATVPSLADARGCQPVVRVSTYDLDGPSTLPIASDVDRLFDTYSRYLETLVVHPWFEQEGSAALTFPRQVPELLARDERLVQLIRDGRFDPLMLDAEDRAWVAEVVAAAQRRG
jgi:hypothetical protein